MKKDSVRRLKKALPGALLLGGLLVGLVSIQTAAVTHSASASAPIEESAQSTAAELVSSTADKSPDMTAADSSLAGGAAGKNSPTDGSATESSPSDESATESIPTGESAAESTCTATREDFIPAGMLAISRSEALEWLRNSVGVSIDFDGAYGAQCVDLLKAYYDYLGVGAQHGNAADYRYNYLPEGWQRLEGVQPEPGDILIYVGGQYGHVAVYESDYSTFHQNWGKSYVINMTDRPYNGISPNRVYWGVVRPFFPEYAGITADDIIDMTRKLSLISLHLAGAAPQGHIDYEAPLPSVFENHREAVLHPEQVSPS